MARHGRLRAQFFVDSKGVCTPRAKGVPTALRFQVFERDNWKCQWCNREVVKFRLQVKFLSEKSVAHADHIFPRALGGQNEIDNLRTLCEPCNLGRGANLNG